MKIIRGVVRAAAMASAFAIPISAASACWDEHAAAAAKLRNLQSKLMVATLRCQAAGVFVQDDYNAFVLANKETLQAANATMKLQFLSAHGSDAINQYDIFTTVLANAFGAGETTVKTCEETASTSRQAASAAGNISVLLNIAEQEVAGPALPGGRCQITFATPAAEAQALAAVRQVPAKKPASVLPESQVEQVLRERDTAFAARKAEAEGKAALMKAVMNKYEADLQAVKAAEEKFARDNESHKLEVKKAALAEQEYRQKLEDQNKTGDE